MNTTDEKGVHRFLKMWVYIKGLTYGGSDFFKTHHEDKMMTIFETFGLIDASDLKAVKKTEMKLLKKMSPGDNVSHMGFENGTYIHQPFNTRAAPDFVVFVNDTFLFIEMKSSKDESLQWNTHEPQRNWIYIFSSKNLHQTTYFLGQGIISDELRPQWERARKRTKELKKEIKELYAGLPLYDYSRTMLMSTDNLKLITDPLREEREKQADEFINSILNA